MEILFLEDELTIREVLTEYMKMQDYEVTCAGDGEEALELLQKQHFDMAVLDIMVPKVSGLEVLSFIKEHRPRTATIMLTALDDEKTQVQAFNLYADDYVIKPVSPIIGEPRRAFTREQLILKIFNEDYVGNDRIIDAHVKNLRKKLPGNYIKTVIGVGYQFQEGEE